MRTAEDFANAISAFRYEMLGRLRRMVVTLAEGAIWQVTGHALFDPARPEVRTVEAWQGIGIYARPTPGGSPEGIVAMIGGADNPQLVAMRDEATRASAVDDTLEDESNLYNSKARVHVKADGTVETKRTAPILAPSPEIRGGDYRAAEEVMLTAMKTFASLMNTNPLFSGAFPAIATGAATLATAIQAFQTAAAAANSFLSTVGKVE